MASLRIKKSIMAKQGVDVGVEPWISKVSISPLPDGSCSVDIIITALRVAAVRNMAENTECFYPASALDAQPEHKDIVLKNLHKEEERVNAKGFNVFTTREDTAKYLTELHKKSPGYTDDLVRKTNLFCTELRELKELKSDYKIDTLQHENKEQCAELSEFQIDNLCRFRKLNEKDQDIIAKTKERYELAAFMSRAESREVIIFTTRREDKLAATITLNLHMRSDIPESSYLGYLSDLFVREGLEDDAIFMNDFMRAVFTKIMATSLVEVLSVMAAAGDPTIPIVKCFNHIQEAKLIHPFTRSEQERLKIAVQFKGVKENESNKHSPPFLTGALSHLSVLAENKRRRLLLSDPIPASAPAPSAVVSR